VKLTFSDLPNGVTVEEKNPTIKKDETKGTFTLKAEGDAPEVGDHKAKVEAAGGGKNPEPASFSVKVVKK